MSNEPEIKPSASSATSESGTPQNQDAAAKEAAAKALGHAKESVAAGVANFKKLDLPNQVYLAGLVVAVLCSFLFSAVSVTVKADGAMADLMKQQGEMMKQHMPSMPTVFDAGGNGRFAVLAAIAGIGLWIWNFMAKKKEAWAPLALAGCAGLSALLYVVLWMRTGGSSMDAGIVKVSASMTLFGFWLPTVGAIAAAVVSVKRILNQPPAATL